MTRACIIGAGLGGLALAIRLQAAGIATTLVEARDQPGGCVGGERRDGFIFDAGAASISDPDAFRALWQLTDRDMAEDVTLLAVSPAWHFSWPDGSQLDLAGDPMAMRSHLAGFAPADAEGYAALTVHQEQARHRASGEGVPGNLAGIAKALPRLARNQGWRTIHSAVASHVKDGRLREALSFPALLTGANPFATLEASVPPHWAARGAVWWVKGGTHRLAMAMAALFQRIGGVLRLHDPVVRIHTLGDRASEVESASGWRERFDAVASNGDLVHTYRDLLADSQRGPDMARRLMRKSYGPGLFVVHFGLEGTWPGIAHNTVLFGPRYNDWIDDVFDHGVLPIDQPVMLHHPSVTDPSIAPPGKSTFCAIVPVANLAKLPIDWEQVGPMLERRVIDEVGRRLVPDIHDRIVTRFHVSPRDLALELNAFAGSAFSLEPSLTQSAWLRQGNRDGRLKNVYLVGAGTRPGAGISGVIASARVTAGLMLEDLRP